MLRFGDYVRSELGIGHCDDDYRGVARSRVPFSGDVGAFEVASAEKLYFLQVPMQLEKLLLLGFFASLDVFLYVFTYLPAKIMCAWCLYAAMLPTACLRACGAGFRRKGLPRRRRPGSSWVASAGRLMRLHRGQLYDVLRGLLVCLGLWALSFVHMSRVYHYIRGQAFIKLYVIFNILEICDRLCCSMGQDILDSLYVTVRHSPQRVVAVIGYFCLSLCYVVIHAVVAFVRLVTLNVALNYRFSNNSLLTLPVDCSRNSPEH